MSTIWYGHFDSTPSDERELTAEVWATYMRALITDGIRNGGTNLQVSSPENGLYIRLDEGIANVQGYIFINTTDESGKYHIMNYPAPDENKKRIDRVVLRLDRRVENRTLLPFVKIGVAADNPKPPELTRNANVWEMSLARVTVLPQAINIANASIEDERFDTDLCGLINSLLKLDTSAWQAEFDRLSDNLKVQHQELLEEARTYFQSQLSAQQQDYTRLANTVTSGLAEFTTQHNAMMDAHESEHNKLISDEKAEFKTQLTTQQQDFKQLSNTVSGFYAAVRQDITKLQTFDFDNLPALTDATRLTSFESNKIITTIKGTYDNRPIADRVVTFSEDGTITKVITVYAEDGISIMKQAKLTSTFNSDGSITTIVNGYDDYNLYPAYITGQTQPTPGTEYVNPDFPAITSVSQGLDAALAAVKEIGWNG